MRPIRLLPLLMGCLLAITLTACGGSSPAPSAAGNGQPSAGASTGNGGPGASQGSGNNNDVEGVSNNLVPPHSTQISKTSAAGGVFVDYESTDSPDSLKSFYESAIPGTGMQILTTSTSQGTYSWIFAQNDQGSSFGGSVTVAPSSTTNGGSTVIVTVANGN